MSATAAQSARPSPLAPSLATQVGELARRSIVRILRQPALIAPGLILPLFMLAVNSDGLSAATKIRGFPTHDYFTFALAIAFMQSAVFATTVGGTDLAEDIRTGFMNRLSLTPMRGSALLVGQLGGVVALTLFQSVVFVLVGVAGGADLKAGVGGAAVLILLSVVTAAGFGAIGLVAALRTASGEAVQGQGLLFFILLFFSSMSLPRHLIETDWFRTVATYNPLSYLVEGMRSLIITGWDAKALALGFGFAAAILAAALAYAAALLGGRIQRT
ncbi:MAG: type transport system permease protein [Thermoleophilaceae bacterium]|jgi:ABC-2 type transport system permease protein|nr:type transport system permease protein [Thermoleophilaceae bacterium]